MLIDQMEIYETYMKMYETLCFPCAHEGCSRWESRSELNYEPNNTVNTIEIP